MFNRPILFVATTNAAAASHFYGDILEFSLLADEPFALVFDCEGITLRVQKVDQLQPEMHTVLGWAVDDIEASVRKLSDKGIAFARYEHMPQDEQGIWSAPGGGRIAWFQDPDGNTLSLTESSG
jgi:catechol 2,3-dioxygenase-like lactoylglutathione lyase family enzyme